VRLPSSASCSDIKAQWNYLDFMVVSVCENIIFQHFRPHKLHDMQTVAINDPSLSHGFTGEHENASNGKCK